MHNHALQGACAVALGAATLHSRRLVRCAGAGAGTKSQVDSPAPYSRRHCLRRYKSYEFT